MYQEFMRYDTPFTKILATNDTRQLIEPFLHIDFDVQRELLGDEEDIKKLKQRELLMRAKTVRCHPSLDTIPPLPPPPPSEEVRMS